MFKKRKEKQQNRKKEERIDELNNDKNKKIDEKYQAEAFSKRKRKDIESFSQNITENQKKYLTATEVELPQLARDTSRLKRKLRQREVLVEAYELKGEIADQDIQLIELEIHETKYGANVESQKERDIYTEKRRKLMERLNVLNQEVQEAETEYEDMPSSDEESKELKYARKLRSSELNPSGSDLDSESSSDVDKSNQNRTDTDIL